MSIETSERVFAANSSKTDDDIEKAQSTAVMSSTFGGNQVHAINAASPMQLAGASPDQVRKDGMRAPLLSGGVPSSSSAMLGADSTESTAIYLHEEGMCCGMYCGPCVSHFRRHWLLYSLHTVLIGLFIWWLIYAFGSHSQHDGGAVDPATRWSVLVVLLLIELLLICFSFWRQRIANSRRAQTSSQMAHGSSLYYSYSSIK